LVFAHAAEMRIIAADAWTTVLPDGSDCPGAEA
jgi:hypothetical protein